MSSIDDLIDAVKQASAWIPYKPDAVTGRQGDEPNPGVPNPLAGTYFRDDEGTTKAGDRVHIRVIRHAETDELWALWMFRSDSDDRERDPLLTKVWDRENPPVGSEVAVWSKPLTTAAASGHKYHPIKVAHRAPTRTLVDEFTAPPPSVESISESDISLGDMF
jgi:hypothetical protein